VLKATRRPADQLTEVHPLRPRPSSRRATRLGLLVPRALLAAVAAGLALGGQQSPASAAPVEEHAEIAAELGGVEVDSAQFRYAQGFYDASVTRYGIATMTRVDAEVQLFTLAGRDLDTTALLTSRSEDKKAAAEDLARIREARRELAVTSYVQGPGVSALEQFDVAQVTSHEGQQVLTRSASDDAQAEQEDAEARYAAAVADINAALAERQAIRDGIASQTSRREQALVEQFTAVADIAQRQLEYTDARALATVVGADFPLVAMDAYWRAAQMMKWERPSCGITWWALAGVGKVESGHGSFGGSELTLTGDTTEEIRGVPLDGTDETANIGDTDGGAIDGDPTTDRAVGPMQFIPSTWESWARDGNGDDIEDPDNLYDAALTAADYLCHASSMTNDAGRISAFLSYNQSDAYAALVLEWSHEYAEVDIPPPPPPPTVPVPAPG
jgi:membrane-bound lytic murein transglycosylase B